MRVSGRSITAGVVAGVVFVLPVWGTLAGCADRTVGIHSEKLLEIEHIREGLGRPASVGSEVNVRYRAQLPDGTVIEQLDLFAQGRSHRFTIGDDTVLAGVNDALVGIKPGGYIRVVVPPLLHYGAGGHAGVIPPESDLIFEIELLAVYE